MKKIVLTNLLTILCTMMLMAQGTISGTIIDPEFGDGMIGANVVIEGTTNGVSTDFEGKYQIQAEAGTYTLVISYVGFNDKKVSGVEVKDGEVTYLDINMEADALDLGVEIVVEAKAIERSENAVLMLQKKSDKIQDGISSQEMSKLAVSDAAGAMKKVTGATVSGGKYIYIRGLGDRYSLTQLNDLVIPSSDPYRNGAQLDLIPSNLLENIITSKTFTPDQPGTFTGGAVNIKTKSFPEQFTLTFSSSLGFNAQNNFNDKFLTHKGGKGDYWGFDDGGRDRPSVFEDDDVQATFQLGASNLPIFTRINRSYTANENDDDPNNDVSYTGLELAQAADKAMKSTNQQFAPTQKSSAIDHGYGITFGNQYKIGEKQALGLIGSVSFKKNYSHLEGSNITRKNWSYFAATPDVLFNEGDFSETVSVESATLNGLIGLAYKLNNLNTITVNAIYNHSGDKSSRSVTGARPDNIVSPDVYQGRELYMQEREMRNLQLGGKHVLEAANMLEVEWKLSQANSSLNDPDRRFFESVYDSENDDYRIPSSDVLDPFHFYRKLDDKQRDAKLDFTLPINDIKLKLGGLYTGKERDFSEYRYQIEGAAGDNFNDVSGDITQFLRDDNIGYIGDRYNADSTEVRGYYLGNYLADRTKPKNQYAGTEKVAAAYIMGSIPVTDALKVVAGARFENTNIEVTSQAVDSVGNFQKGKINKSDVLPSLNLIYALNDKMNLRASYNGTIARPNMREIAPFESEDPITKQQFLGNPNLKRTKIHNVDLRWEWFINPGEIVALSGYYKDFTDAIVLFRNPEGGGNFFKFDNVKNANLYGIELEFRKDLEALVPVLKNFKFATNLSFIRSNSDVNSDHPLDPKTRPFEGQADFILNASLIYSNFDQGLDAALSLNTTGDKLAIIGIQGNPDIYDRGRSQLDFNISKKFKDLSVRFSAKNLLNSRYLRSSEFKGNEYVYSKFNRGISFGLGISYTVK